MVNRIVITVREHIIADESLTRAGIAVGIEEPLDDGVIISALKVVESGFC